LKFIFYDSCRGVARRVWAPSPQKFWPAARAWLKIFRGGAKTLLATPLDS